MGYAISVFQNGTLHFMPLAQSH
uniref:Uncharacterized protein n=1 Tax=Anguilla anguilla TaxID=7936 RepID=A0A0E9VIU6_ANGAN